MKNLLVLCAVMALAVSASPCVEAEEGMVDVMTFENGEAKMIQMSKEEADAKYVDIAPPVQITLDRKAEKEEPRAEQYYSEGVQLLQGGEFQKALEAFIEADKLQPGEPNVYNSLAMAYQKTGDHDRALEYFKKALEINPESAEYLVNLAFYYYDLGKCDLALPNFQKALNLNSQMGGLSRYIDECSQ